MKITPNRLARLGDDVRSGLGEAVAGYFLRCDRCSTERRPSPVEMAAYFRDGWPRCCGETMKLTAHGERRTS